MPETRCQHAQLRCTPSAHAVQIGHRQYSPQQRARASGKRQNDASGDLPTTFPAPLILPGDELALDPGHPPQSLRAWQGLTDRNAVTQGRKVIYVAEAPVVGAAVEFIEEWAFPRRKDPIAEDVTVNAPRIQDIVDYLRAFYHGLPVRLLPTGSLSFTTWDDNASSARRNRASQFIGLKNSTECVRIRTRVSPDGLFGHQLNLDDLLDTALASLPTDAYALILVVEHDLFESADEFVCGRAYGGSRVAVISTARYNPKLDLVHGVEEEHSWPASHCDAFVKRCCEADSRIPTRPRKRAKPSRSLILEPSASDVAAPVSSMHAALAAFKALPLSKEPLPSTTLSGLWFARVCRTASHELGHCFGMEHCVYYACVMQGSASLAEDVRQPPYLCPVDLAKLLQATKAQEDRRYAALLSFCEAHVENQMFIAFAAWIRARLEALGMNVSSRSATSRSMA